MDKPVRKKFDYELFRANDKLARDIGKKYWLSQKYEVMDNPDKYGPDLIVKDPIFMGGLAEEFYCELEIKRAWKGKEFKYRTCQIPQRKAKFLDKSKYNMPCHFFIINNEYQYAFYIEDQDVASSPLVEVPNRYVPEGELFFQVSLDKCRLIELESNEKAKD
jgi:hypothetical protein